MSLKFDVSPGRGEWDLSIQTEQATITVGASEGELRRLLIDLIHEIPIDDYVPPEDRRDDAADEPEGDS